MPISAANADDPNPRVLAWQHEFEIYFNEDGGLVLKQANWPDDDSLMLGGCGDNDLRSSGRRVV
jgi:hypothetical protein